MVGFETGPLEPTVAGCRILGHNPGLAHAPVASFEHAMSHLRRRVAPWTAIPILLASATAQGDYDLDKATPCTLGQNLVLQVRAAPQNRLMLVMPSYSGGPTPIAGFDPADPRSVQVGLDLVAGWWFVFTSPSGTASISLALPTQPSYHGQVLHWQTATLPGTSTAIDRLSNKVVTQLGLTNSSLPTPGSLGTARALAGAFFHRSRNGGQGDLVIAGGGTGTLTSSTGLQSSEIWDFRTLTAVPGPNLTVARASHTTSVLNDGRVLLAGGVDGLGAALATCEIYDPATNTFTATGSLAAPRALHAAVTMPDGRVMVAGGTASLTDTTAAITNVLNTVEIFHPASGTWSNGPVIGGRRLAPALSRLNTGRILVSGGVEVTFFLGIPLGATSTNKAQLYNPATNSWSNAANMRAGRAGHDQNQVTLTDGRLLLTGGVLVPDLLNAANAAPIADAEYYNPAANTWTAVNLSQARALHSATLLPDGRVAVCGGSNGTLTAPVSIDGVEVFSPVTNTWTSMAPLDTPRASHTAAVLPDGSLLLLGGQGTAGTLRNGRIVRL